MYPQQADWSWFESRLQNDCNDRNKGKGKKAEEDLVSIWRHN